MVQKSENCLYCGSKMESKTAKKKFCSDKCRVYFNRTVKVESYDAEMISNITYDEPAFQSTNAFIPVIEKMPDGLTWKEQLEWKRNHKK